MPSRTLSEQEWDTIKDRVLASAPKGMDETAYQRWIGPAMSAAIGEAENSPAPFDSGASMRALKGLWQNTGGAALSTAEALVNPDARNRMAMQMGLDMSDQASQARTAPTRSERIGHGVAAALPGIGPASAHAGDTIASGDWAGGIGQSVGLLAPPAMMEALTKLRGATTGPSGTALADRLESGATNRLAQEMGPKVGPNKVRLTNSLAKVSPDLLRESGLNAFTKEGFATKVAGKLDDAIAAMDDAADNRLASQQVKTASILSAIDAEIAQKTAQPVEGSQFPRSPNPPGAPTKGQQVSGITGEIRPGDVATTTPIGQAVEPAPSASQIATLRKIRGEVAQLGSVAPYEAIRRIRSAWDQVARVKFMPATAQDALSSQGAAQGAVRGTAALREGLSQADPASAAAYRQYSIFKSANDVLTAAQEAERARPTVGRGLMRTGSGTVAGAVSAGAPGAAVGAIVGYVLDRASSYAPTMQVFIARQMQGIADALRRGDTQAAQTQAVSLKASLPTVQDAAVPRASGQ